MDNLKRCTACERDLPVENFSTRSDTGRLYSQCRECKGAKSSAYYKNNVQRHAKLVKRRYETHGRFARYGITAEQYDAVFKQQGNCCALCKSTKPGGKGKWHIDHRHVGDKPSGFIQTRDPSLFRGILCHRCNIAVGHSEILLERVGKDKLKAYLAPPH